MSTSPVIICCQLACKPIYGRPVFSKQMTNTPSREPSMDPAPPVAETPPIIAPPMASSSKPAPVPGYTVANTAE